MSLPELTKPASSVNQPERNDNMDSVIGRLDSSVFSMLRENDVPRIKICGLRRPEDIDFVNRLRPDFIGFIFDPTKGRYVAPDDAKELRKALSPVIKAVGVFVDAETDDIVKTVDEVSLDLVQLHGSEDNEYINSLRRKMHSRIPIIKAFRVQSADDIAAANDSAADYVLLDNGTGTGETFDWTVASGAVINKPFFLAGGLGPENVRKAIDTFHPDVVDASTSLETDGYKDFEKMKNFVSAVRSHGAAFVD